jgi:hypothetical protein
METNVRTQQSRIAVAPIGTKATSFGGGHWYKTERGWKWNGPDGRGGTFPTPGGDWDGRLIFPEDPDSLYGA